MQVEIQGVGKDYATVRAVDDVNLVARGGQILALLGPNGAGKSSLVRMMVGLTQPDQGTIRYQDNGAVSEHLATTAFGYLPEDRGLYLDRTVNDNLRYIAKLRGMEKQAATDSIAHWLERFDLTERATEPMRQLSKGNQQKVQLIATLLHRPQLVILDEPFSGLDPVNQEFVLSVLEELRNAGKTVILSAHQMALVERMADQLVLMNKGRVIAQGSLAEVRETLLREQQLRVEFAQSVNVEQLTELAQVNAAQGVTATEFELSCIEQVQLPQLLSELQAIAPVVQFSRKQQGLHELYLQAVQA
jgi:ABC-2 type transport system ATP-binding protein